MMCAESSRTLRRWGLHQTARESFRSFSSWAGFATTPAWSQRGRGCLGAFAQGARTELPELCIPAAAPRHGRQGQLGGCQLAGTPTLHVNPTRLASPLQRSMSSSKPLPSSHQHILCDFLRCFVRAAQRKGFLIYRKPFSVFSSFSFKSTYKQPSLKHFSTRFSCLFSFFSFLFPWNSEYFFSTVKILFLTFWSFVVFFFFLNTITVNIEAPRFTISVTKHIYSTAKFLVHAQEQIFHWNHWLTLITTNIVGFISNRN